MEDVAKYSRLITCFVKELPTQVPGLASIAYTLELVFPGVDATDVAKYAGRIKAFSPFHALEKLPPPPLKRPSL